jgi:ribosome biogenesis GTPase
MVRCITLTFSSKRVKPLNTKTMTLAELGWRPTLQQQISFEELETGFPARVNSVYRDRVHVSSEQGDFSVLVAGILDSDDPEQRATTGDWLWLEYETNRPLKMLERMNVLKRTAAGSDPRPQLIASNLDTLFIVSSCNKDFNISRIERYLSLVLAAKIPAVIVLTKADLADDADAYVEQAQAIHRDVPVFKVNALSTDISQDFTDWTGKGQTIAFLGSSGVGKSTLTNSLLGHEVQDTGGIREDDAKGRHTTTDRSMHQIDGGGWVLDTPGMRELRLNDDAAGVSELFEDIEQLMTHCKFNNCHHQGDHGCAIDAALASGELDERRWNSYSKLQKEAEHASLTKQERKKAAEKWGKEISKFARQHKKTSHKH